MNVSPALITDGKATEAAEPRQRAFNNPMVPTELFAAVDPASSNPGLDAALTQGLAAAWHVLGLVAGIDRVANPKGIL